MVNENSGILTNNAGARRSRRQIEPGAVHAVLDLNNPKIGIKPDFPFEPFLGLVGTETRSRVRAGENPVDTARRVRRDGLRRGSIERRAPVQVIDFDENGARLRSAPPAEDRAYPFHPTSTQIGRDPNVGAQTQRI
jgi:hypothetical protein